ncbi:MAG: hypothetical protein D6690_12815 [Nitrospirae bacterium]|nr:MAG: hypothetical protein D6690_12815 [Nitrospirota bacterium]
MTEQQTASWYVDMTETFVRFYVFLAQSIDRCLNESLRTSPPEEEFDRHFASITAQMFDHLAGNRVVKAKVEQEYKRIAALAKALYAQPNDIRLRQELESEREVLRIKMLVLSDLLAVFRSV